MGQVYTHLNIPAGSSMVDEQDLRTFAEAGCDAVEQECGPIEMRTVVDERVIGSRAAVVLSEFPVTTVVSVSYLGVSGSVSDYRIERLAGVLSRWDGGVIPDGTLITYTVGQAIPPSWAVGAAKIIVKHLWRTQRLSRADAQEAVPGAGFAVPNAAATLMRGHRLPPGSA